MLSAVRDRHPIRVLGLLGVSGYSRWIVGRMIPSGEAQDVLSGHLKCLVVLGGVPRKSVYDKESAIAHSREGPGADRHVPALPRQRWAWPR